MADLSCCMKLVKCLLFLFNVLWLILGGAVIYFGVIVLNFSKDVDDIVDSTPRTAAIILLTTGCVIFFIAFLGCCGAIKESSCLLWTYGAIILLLVVVECVGAYFAFKYHQDIEEVIRRGITKNFANFNADPQIKKIVNTFQHTFSCCGLTNYTDWQTNGWSSAGKWPGSCCGIDFAEECTDQQMNGTAGHRNGCLTTVKDSISMALGGIGGVAIGLVFLQILIVISACCLAREFKYY